jgi:threonine/homoserine/homoserine lactone efflux protein
LFPQFIDQGAGSEFAQSLVPGVVHVGISTLFDGLLVTIAGALATWFAARPLWLLTQRWCLGGAFGVLAVWLALTQRHHA